MISPKRSLGQNFLRDENIARNIVESLQLSQSDHVLEIGPGTGSLTKHLVGKAGSLTAVEIDPRAVQTLAERFGEEVRVIQEDVVRVSLSELAEKHGRKIRVVGNIPYYMTSEIFFWLIEQRKYVHDAILMVQLEVARRLAASVRTKDYGIMSVVSQLYTIPTILFKVSRNSFYPKPAVDSAVVCLLMKETVPEHNEALFRNVVRATFGKRRKTLMNGLRYMGFREETLRRLPFDLQRRPEELDVTDFVRLTTMLEPFMGEISEMKFSV